MANPQYRSRFGDTTLTKVFVGGLAWETTDEELWRYFEPFGEILEAVIITDKNTGRSKGYGFEVHKPGIPTMEPHRPLQLPNTAERQHRCPRLCLHSSILPMGTSATPAIMGTNRPCTTLSLHPSTTPRCMGLHIGQVLLGPHINTCLSSGTRSRRHQGLVFHQPRGRPNECKAHLFHTFSIQWRRRHRRVKPPLPPPAHHGRTASNCNPLLPQGSSLLTQLSLRRLSSPPQLEQASTVRIPEEDIDNSLPQLLFGF